MNKKGASEGLAMLGIVLIIIIGICALFWVIPQYDVYARELAGKAELKQAEWNRQIAIQEAQAELESATLKKQSDIIRAEGIAEANTIISKSLTKEYIQWKWVEGLHDGSSETIYIPTEANMPILEAVRGMD